LFNDEFAELINEAVDKNDTGTLVEAIEGLAEQVAMLTEENAELNRVAFDTRVARFSTSIRWGCRSPRRSGYGTS
jgi:hypothetical protein